MPNFRTSLRGLHVIAIGSTFIDTRKRNRPAIPLLHTDWFERRIGPYLPSCDDLGIPPITGQLGCSLEGAGKRRIFAIGNYVNQRLLKPVHLWFASVLRSIQMDGTFNQTIGSLSS